MLNRQPHLGGSTRSSAGTHRDPDSEPPRRRRATYNRPHGVWHLFAAYDLATDKVYGHGKPSKTRAKFREVCRYLRTLYPLEVRLAIVCDNFSPHLIAKKSRRVADWAELSNVEIAYTPTNSPWLNRIDAQFPALRHLPGSTAPTTPATRNRPG
ncbi:transposase [Rhodococcus opacus]|uniref:transposase n=1 Tax=Rhodococcus opacus TaxID=37919 RepID=UPI001C441386|nr:transposase [Rhodococcus opacus]MBV6756651.1 transposase [Rhodococcus opacus]